MGHFDCSMSVQTNATYTAQNTPSTSTYRPRFSNSQLTSSTT
jgi:hypothetical protein